MEIIGHWKFIVGGWMIKNRLTYFIIVSFLFILGTVFSVRDILLSDISMSVFSLKPQHIEIKSPNSRLLKGQIMSGTFTAENNYFGIIETPIEPQQYKSRATLQLRIREQSQPNWYYQGDYDTSWITETIKFQFGFPIIINSKDKTYYFEIESLQDVESEAIRFNNLQQNLILKYQYPVHDLKNNPKTLVHFLIGKTNSALQDINLLTSIFTNFLPLIFFLSYSKIIELFRSIHFFLEKSFNKRIINDEIKIMHILVVIGVNCLAGIFIYWPFLTFQTVFIQHIHDFHANLLPNYIHIRDLITHFEFPVWSFSLGLGTNIFAGNFMRVSIVDPFTWITYFFNGKYMLLAFPYILVLKIIIAGIAFYLYLRFNKISHTSSLVFSTAYAISGQMIVRSPWYHYTTEMVFLPFLLISIDQFLEKKKIWPTVLCFIWLGSYHLYHVFLYSFFSFYYVGWKYWLTNTMQLSAWKKNIITFIKLYAHFTLAILIGLLLSAVILFPNIYNYLHSSRSLTFQSIDVEQSYSIDSFFVNTQLFFLIIIRFFGNGITGYLGNYSGWLNSLEDPNLFTGMLSLVFFCVFPFYFKRKKIFFIGTIFIIASYLFIPYIRNIWNIFYGNRFKTSTFFIVPTMLLLASISFDRFIKNHKPDIILKRTAITITCFFIISSLIILNPRIKDITINFEPFIFKLLLLAVIIFVATKYVSNRVIILITISIFSMIYFNAKYIQSGAWIKFDYTERQSQNIINTKKALQYIGTIDDGFYRVNKNFALYDLQGINDAVAINYLGTTTYQSFNEASLTKFATYWDPYNKTELGSRVFNGFIQDNLYLNDLLVEKYYLSINQNEKPDNFKKIKTISEIDIYINETVIPFGTIFSHVITEDVLESFTQNEYQEITRRAVLIQDEIKKDLTGIAHIKKKQNLTTIESAKTHLDVSQFKNTYIAGTVTTNKKGIILFQFPYNEGWQLQINDRDADLFEVNAGLTGAIITPGKHKIELEYQQPYLNVGIAVSIATILVCVIVNKKNSYTY